MKKSAVFLINEAPSIKASAKRAGDTAKRRPTPGQPRGIIDFFQIKLDPRARGGRRRPRHKATDAYLHICAVGASLHTAGLCPAVLCPRAGRLMTERRRRRLNQEKRTALPAPTDFSNGSESLLVGGACAVNERH